jgi:hypothetical protein
LRHIMVAESPGSSISRQAHCWIKTEAAEQFGWRGGQAFVC